MQLVLLGPPGAGKGTQAKLLKEKLNIPHISTGDIFRSNISEGTELGKKAKEHMDRGELVPDEFTIGLVEDRIAREDCSKGFLLDGFPRTIFQAEKLDEILAKTGTKIDYAINLQIDDKIIIKRLTERRICPGCGRIFQGSQSASESTPESQKCEICGCTLIQRPDDREETIVERLRVYHEQTEPLIDYYSRQGKLLEIEGSGRVADVHRNLLNKLEVLE
ncbi:MAG: adenylate kinase [Eubacteriales bacterium]|nr:adenylate kinase [Eubacteriales bacterium]